MTTPANAWLEDHTNYKDELNSKWANDRGATYYCSYMRAYISRRQFIPGTTYLLIYCDKIWVKALLPTRYTLELRRINCIYLVSQYKVQ